MDINEDQLHNDALKYIYSFLASEQVKCFSKKLIS